MFMFASSIVMDFNSSLKIKLVIFSSLYKFSMDLYASHGDSRKSV